MYLTYDEFKSLEISDISEENFKETIAKAETQIDMVTNFFYANGLHDLQNDLISSNKRLNMRAKAFKKALGIIIYYAVETGVSSSNDAISGNVKSLSIGRTHLDTSGLPLLLTVNQPYLTKPWLYCFTGDFIQRSGLPMMPRVPLRFCNQSIILKLKNGKTDLYNKPDFDDYQIDNMVYQPQTIYSGDNNSRKITANAIAFLYPGISTNVPKLKSTDVGSKLVFDGDELTITNIVTNLDPYSNEVYSYELEVL
ncbi:putative minor capsid protein [Pediococcus pentosaceus]|uniref:putative minor capsid protein n=2 Tax=Pediococcus pentosaceus TaxID=1255 RepID=UPI001E5794FA|nr:putative minor capsid protein [Pediococcus pentosaceus]